MTWTPSETRELNQKDGQNIDIPLNMSTPAGSPCLNTLREAYIREPEDENLRRILQVGFQG